MSVAQEDRVSALIAASGLDFTSMREAPRLYRNPAGYWFVRWRQRQGSQPKTSRACTTLFEAEGELAKLLAHFKATGRFPDG